MKNIFTVYFFLVSGLLSLASCSTINEKLHLSDDNLGEEIIEDVIKQETGIDMDLTPNSKE
jgi:hypothetical protein